MFLDRRSPFEEVVFGFFNRCSQILIGSFYEVETHYYSVKNTLINLINFNAGGRPRAKKKTRPRSCLSI